MTSPTGAQLVDETLGKLAGFTGDSQLATTLSGDMTATDLTFAVTAVRSGTVGISPGVIEIGTELIYASDVDFTNGTVTVPAWGRGYNSTTAAAHTSGDRVVSQPVYPRNWVLETLNQILGRTFPRLFVPKVATLTTQAPASSVTYDLPEDAEWVLDARWQVPAGRHYWRAIKRMRWSNGGTTVTGDPGISVDIADCVLPGQPIEFTYAARPGLFTSEVDDFATVTGLPLSCRDVLVFGAASALTSGQEVARLDLASMEQQDRARIVPASAALTTSRFLDQYYQERLSEEAMSLRKRYPPRITGTWV